MSVVEALASVMSDVQAVAKNDRNDFHKFNFRGIDAVVNAVGPALRKHGVVVVPSVDHVEYAQVQTTNDKTSTACRVVVTYTFWHGNTYLPCKVAAEAWDHGDKATPKAMSVAFRTALLQALSLPTDEPDPDHHTYEQVAEVPAEPVDLTALNELIDTAVDVGIEKDWDKLREWAAQSDGHLVKACEKVSRALDDASVPA